MTFQHDINSEKNNHLNQFKHGGGQTCFVCSKPVTQAVVYHDGVIDGAMLVTNQDNTNELVNQEKNKHFAMLIMHPSCASILGQRLISDGYVNRNKE